MSERKKPHFGRATDGDRHVKREDFEDKETDPQGPDFIRDDVRLGGAVADTGPTAGQRGEEIQALVDENREIVDKTAEHNRDLG